MHRHELEHIIRAAAEVSRRRDVVVVGSQAILATDPQAPSPLSASAEADVYVPGDQEATIEIAGVLGEDSRFHQRYGYYAHGVGEETASAPAAWQERLIPISNANTGGATGWCMEPHDLVLSKLAAGRPKDIRFALAAVQRGLVDPEELRARVKAMPLSASEKRAVAHLIPSLSPTQSPP